MKWFWQIAGLCLVVIVGAIFYWWATEYLPDQLDISKSDQEMISTDTPNNR